MVKRHLGLAAGGGGGRGRGGRRRLTAKRTLERRRSDRRRACKAPRYSFSSACSAVPWKTATARGLPCLHRHGEGLLGGEAGVALEHAAHAAALHRHADGRGEHLGERWRRLPRSPAARGSGRAARRRAPPRPAASTSVRAARPSTASSARRTAGARLWPPTSSTSSRAWGDEPRGLEHHLGDHARCARRDRPVICSRKPRAHLALQVDRVAGVVGGGEGHVHLRQLLVGEGDLRGLAASRTRSTLMRELHDGAPGLLGHRADQRARRAGRRSRGRPGRRRRRC